MQNNSFENRWCLGRISTSPSVDEANEIGEATAEAYANRQ